MICGCDHVEDSKMHIVSLDFLRALPFEASLVTPKLALFDSHGREKNNLQRLRQESPVVLRPQGAQRTGSVLRGHAHLLGDRGSARHVQELRQGEERKAFVVGRQSVLHQTLRFLCRSALQGFDDPRRCQRTASGLEDGQRSRQAIHARTTAQDRDAWAENHRD